MNIPIVLFAVSSALVLAACSDRQENSAATDLNAADTAGQAAAKAAALEAGDFMALQLGAKIVGPMGPEVKGTMSNAEGNFADIRSYVACPAGMDPCVPKTAPEGTIYTYVHVVYPGADNAAKTGSGTSNTSSDIERATGFRMIMPAHGFTGVAGYSKDEALSAIGEKADVVISCVDGGLSWTVSAGDGGNQWGQAEPLTFYWQSTLPPAGPEKAYAIDANYAEAIGAGPYPAAKDGVANVCG